MVRVVIEGCDRAGKTTQCRLLLEALKRDFPHRVIREWAFPNRKNQTGKVIDKYLSSDVNMDPRAVHLLFSANRWEDNKILEQCDKGDDIVIFDRYVDSGIAYSVAKGLDCDWCQSSDRGFPEPDVRIFLDIDPDMAATRDGFGEERHDNVEFLRKVREYFSGVKEKYKVIDASQRPTQVHFEIYAHVHKTLFLAEK